MSTLTRESSAPTSVRRATSDRDEAERIVTDLYLPNRLGLSNGSGPLDMEVSGGRLGAITVSRLTYGRQVDLRTADAEHFHVNITTRGRAWSRSGAATDPVATSPGEGLVFSPEAPAHIAWSADCEQLCLMIPRRRLEDELEQMLGRPLRHRLIFDFTANLHSPEARRWRTALDLLVDELDHPTGIGRDPHVGRHVEGLVISALLLSQSHNHRDAIHRERVIAAGRTVGRAVELMEDRPSEPWTTVRLAAEVHVSVRTLQEGFRRELKMPPMSYLRHVRLRRARELLAAAGRETTTVSAVAHSVGILHLGRFAAAYRNAFGEGPSDTLRRPRLHGDPART
jgi:AraC-like DNA-binding protein